MKTWMLAGATALLLGGTAQAMQEAAADAARTALRIGDKAPALDHVKWIKGEPIPTWQPGHIYVIDFWATWCGPCRASIPHVNELAKKLAADNVTVIGAAIWPRDDMVPTADYVQQKGDAMSYPIAEDIDGHTAKAWMEAAGRNGIPTAMVVDRQGAIAWMGHPMDGLDGVLEHVIKGDYDVKAAAEKIEKDEALARQVMALQKDLVAARKEQDWVRCATLAESIVALDPEAYGQFAVYAYSYRLAGGDKAGAATYGRQLAEGMFKEKPAELNMLAWAIVDPKSAGTVEERDLELALLAGQRADELTSNSDPSVIDTVARVHFLKGNFDQAVTLQTKALELASDERMKAEFQTRLDEYTQAKSHG